MIMAFFLSLFEFPLSKAENKCYCLVLRVYNHEYRHMCSLKSQTFNKITNYETLSKSQTINTTTIIQSYATRKIELTCFLLPFSSIFPFLSHD